jgi:hypothetical protein
MTAAISTVRDDSESQIHTKDSIRNRPLREEIPSQTVTLLRGSSDVAGRWAREFAAVDCT